MGRGWMRVEKERQRTASREWRTESRERERESREQKTESGEQSNSRVRREKRASVQQSVKAEITWQKAVNS
jgi:hypothetical protein